VLNLDDLVLDGVYSRYQVERLPNTCLIATGSDEWDMVFP
jgi:hypothetical protein